MRVWQIAGAVSALLSLTVAGCTTLSLVQADTATFHNMPADFAGKKFHILPLPNQEGTPEFNLYAQEIAAKLTAKGLVQTMAAPETDYVLMFSYGADNGRTEVNTFPVYGQTGGGTSTVEVKPQSGIGPSYTATVQNNTQYGVVGTGTSTSVVYKHTLDVRLALKPTQNPNDKITYVYQGTATSDDTSSAFASVGSCLINVLFEDFPGTNGRTTSQLISGADCVR